MQPMVEKLWLLLFWPPIFAVLNKCMTYIRYKEELVEPFLKLLIFRTFWKSLHRTFRPIKQSDVTKLYLSTHKLPFSTFTAVSFFLTRKIPSNHQSFSTMSGFSTMMDQLNQKDMQKVYSFICWKKWIRWEMIKKQGLKFFEYWSIFYKLRI